MSILSADAQSSTSSSPEEAPSINPNPDHGILLQPPGFSQSPPPSVSHHIPSFGSLRISDPQPLLPVFNEASGPLASAAAESGQSSEKVNEVGTPNGKRNLPHHTSKQSPSNSVEQGLGAAHAMGKGGASSTSLLGQETFGSISTHGSAPQASGRKPQMTNGNYLLNFRYNPISRPQPRAPPPLRRKQKIKPYNKDLFLQANYRFVLLEPENHMPELMDPDKMLQWEDIICLKYSTPELVQCPICLEYPLCPQITSCGHIFCFPCILRYLLMGQEDHKGECWKKCPLCFMMICSKDLYTIYIEHVKNYSVGDTIEFMLLTRQKDSNVLSQKYKQETEAKGSCSDEIYDLFSKFTFTCDVDLSVRKAISDLDSWLVKADSGPVDDIEKLPYVCAAMEQLEQRKKHWNEHKGFSSNIAAKKFDEGACLFQSAEMVDSLEGSNRVLSSSCDEKNSLGRHINDSRDPREKDLYNFYQAVDGQHLILHPLNMKCLLHHYGSYDMLPDRINGKILHLETVTQSEAIRRRYRYLSHFSLTTTFQLCEIDLSEILPLDSLSPFMDEIKKREKQRTRLARKEQIEKSKVEAAIARPVPFSAGEPFYQNPPEFSMDDFEALGSPALTSSSPPTHSDKKLFSSVAKLGFAAAHDSPALSIEGAHPLHNAEAASNSSGGEKGDQSGPSTATGLRNPGMESFANVTSREKSCEPKMNETAGKKGKKASRVLLSTAGGRRY